MAAPGPSRLNERTFRASQIRNGHKRQTTILFVTWLILLVIIGMFAALYLYPRPTPIAALSFDPSDITLTTQIYCPGDQINFTTELIISQPMVVQTNMSVIDVQTQETVPGTEFQIPMRPRPFVSSQPLTIKWTVPNLPPGTYTRVTGATALNQGSQAAFLSVPFTIAEGCP